MESEKIKIMAYYLPQYHEMEINNQWWGKGFTEWDNVKKAKPLFSGHNQPNVPLDKNYYDLSNVDVMRWQAEIARNHGVYGFCFYHYWFDNEPIMEKPILNFLNNSDININYCICWANESWTNAWARKGLTIIKEQKYGQYETWKKHFEFLLPFFKDKRYIKEDNKPLIVIYRPYLFEKMDEIIKTWNELAIENGFNGLKVASQRFEREEIKKNRQLFDQIDYHIEYQPRCYAKRRKGIKAIVHDFILNHMNIDIIIKRKNRKPNIQDYDEMWKEIVELKASDSKMIAGGFVNEDTTPRHDNRGRVTVGVSPEKFRKYISKQICNVMDNYTPQYLFIFAWNEWGEGAYLEPDEAQGFAYLDALKKAIEDVYQ